MASNVYTKNEILQSLASKGYFIDAYTLDTFFEKWKVEAIFEDEQGSEFYDKNALDLVMENLFNSPDEDNSKEIEEPRILKEPENVSVVKPAQEQQQFNPQAQLQYQQPYIQPQYQQPPQFQQQQPYQQSYQQSYRQQNNNVYQTNNNAYKQNNFAINDVETNNILNNISLSDGTPLANKVQGVGDDVYNIDYEMLRKETEAELGLPPEPEMDSIFSKKEEKKMGILEGAMIAAGQEPEVSAQDGQEATAEVISPNEVSEFDDMTLLSESMEAQEKFREYVVSELSKKNVDLTPKGGEFKLDISERTLNMIARTMAKKIANHVSKLCANGALTSGQLTEALEENKKLEQKTKDLEEQNKKLRLLLAESNRNLNSYRPSIFGLYKKVPPGSD